MVKEEQSLSHANQLSHENRERASVVMHPDDSGQIKATIHHYLTHDAVNVPALISNAKHIIVLHAAFYPKYGLDSQGEDLRKALEGNPSLKLTVIFTDAKKASWSDEFAVSLRDYFLGRDKFEESVRMTKEYFINLRDKIDSERVSILDTARLPFFPMILIDNTIIVGHYAHSKIIPPLGFWFTITYPKIHTMYESLLYGRTPECNREEEAILRYLEELLV